MKPPIADKIPFSYKVHDQEIRDEYAWMRDPNWPNVEDKKILQYITEENEFYKNFFTPFENKKEEVFHELKGRIKLSDQSTYLKKDNYYYYTRTEEYGEYPIYCRKSGSIEATEEVLLNVNELAKGKNFTKIGSFAVSPDHKLLAYSIDFTGDENYVAKILDLESGKYLPDEISNTIDDLIWHENIGGFFYALANEKWRHDKIMFHKLGTASEDDLLIFHEKDPLYQVNVSKTSSRKYIIIDSGGHDNNQQYIISMDDENFSPKLFKPKQEGVYYHVEHNKNHFYIKTNYQAKNFKIALVNVENFDKEAWSDYIAEETNEYLSDFDITEEYLILNYKKLGLPLIKIKQFKDGLVKMVDFPDEAFTAESFSTNFKENDIRIVYSSFKRPNTTFSYNFEDNNLSILKIQEIPSGFNPEEYEIERKWVKNENVNVPITIFYKKSTFNKDGSNPLYLYGYGAYGISHSLSFNNKIISLVNRGFVFVLAHIRGGDELGYEWYEAAKFLNKKRTFEDFIKSAEYLIREKYTNIENIVISGGSAGGLLIGAVINERPELFKAGIAHSPFVDVLNTMLDESLPLTPGEFKEWGNPKEKKYFDYMKTYCPYENIKAQKYPHLLVTAGLSDLRVGYWEAAKWVARLRANKVGDNRILFKTNIEAGHTGSSGRFDYLKEIAEELIFIFKIFDKL